MKKYTAVAAIAAAALFALYGLQACSAKPKGEQVTAVNGMVSIGAKQIGKGEVRFFRYQAGGKDVVFFTARSASGEVKTAFDACVTCFPHRMGYRQEGDRIVCIYCNTSFHIDELDRGKGNCMPIGINHRLEKDTILIDKKELDSGAAWF